MTSTRPSWSTFTAALNLISSYAKDSATVEQTNSVPVATTTEPRAETTVVEDAAPGDLPPVGAPELLSEWSQLETRDGRLIAREGVTPDTLTSALSTDYAHKLRTVWTPADAAAATSDPDQTFDFPVGTVITKTLYYSEPDGAAEVSLTDSDDRGHKVTRQRFVRGRA